MMVPIAAVDVFGGGNAVFGVVDGASLGRGEPADKSSSHLAYGLRQQIVQIGCGVDRMRSSGHRHVLFGGMQYLSPKVEFRWPCLLPQGSPSASITTR